MGEIKKRPVSLIHISVLFCVKLARHPSYRNTLPSRNTSCFWLSIITDNLNPLFFRDDIFEMVVATNTRAQRMRHKLVILRFVLPSIDMAVYGRIRGIRRGFGM
jgi:hypothetical protein